MSMDALILVDIQNDFVPGGSLRKMQDHQRKQGYDAKVKAWLEKPEQAELVKSLKATISPNIKPEKQAQTLVNQAKNYIRNTGIKIS